VHHKFVRFDAGAPHQTLPVQGNAQRLTATFFVHVTSGNASAADKSRMRALGAPLPSAAERDAARADRKASRAKGKQRQADAAKQWRMHTGAATTRHCPGRKPGYHLLHAWRCRYCKKTGTQSVGQPKKYCDPKCRDSHYRIEFKRTMKKVRKHQTK
jgi:hypothetical protein